MTKTIPDVIGRYEVQRGLGGGGMGVLYLARDPGIDRLVAVKVLRDGLDSSEVRERFTREARSAGRLHHPNIVTIFDVGEHAGEPFIAMEYIRGETLADVIRRQTPTSLIRKLQWMEDLCAGLHYAHRAGIIHRDIKPGNVMISDDGVVKLLDFGIARLGPSAMTQGIIGTLNYMAPEQMGGQAVDARADIFSLGALFYELLSYRHAFPGDLTDGILFKILSNAVEPLENVVPGIDPQLVGIVNRCLEKRPSDRYPDCSTLAREVATVRLRLQHNDAGGADFMAWSPDADTVPIDLAKIETPKRARQRLELLRIRAEQIRSHLDGAQAAMKRSDHESAVRECERALVLDPEHTEALDLADRARSAMEKEQIDQWVAEGGDELGRGALTAASLLVERALSLNSGSPQAIALRQAVDEARRQLAEAQERRRRLEEVLASAAREMKDGALEQAAAAVTDALAIDATSEAARVMRARIAAAIEAKRGEESEALAVAAVTQARHLFVAGNHSEAIELLKRFEPSHELVARTLAELQLEARELARRAEAERLQAEGQRPQESRGRAEAERVQPDSRTVILASLPGSSVTAASQPVRREPHQPVPQQSRFRGWHAVGLAVAIVGVIGVAIVWRLSFRGVPESSAPPTPKPVPSAPAPPAKTPQNQQQPPQSSVTETGGTTTSLPPVAEDWRERLLTGARTALDQKHYGSAVRTFQKLLEQFPGDVEVRTALGSARATDARQGQKAKDLVGQGDRAEASRDYNEAIRLYQSAVDEYPDARDARTKLERTKAAKTSADAVAAQILNRPGGSTVNTAGLSDERRAALFKQADALMEARLFDNAIVVYDQILAAEPDNAAAKTGKAKAVGLKVPRH